MKERRLRFAMDMDKKLDALQRKLLQDSVTDDYKSNHKVQPLVKPRSVSVDVSNLIEKPNFSIQFQRRRKSDTFGCKLSKSYGNALIDNDNNELICSVPFESTTKLSKVKNDVFEKKIDIV